ncbi:hypothetical protein E9O_01401 [Moraxella catarrhalis 12P80B1]|nr:hypothetical protein E9O_01401 [Moraxella catarrhalis 12P80B1]
MNHDNITPSHWVAKLIIPKNAEKPSSLSPDGFG